MKFFNKNPPNMPIYACKYAKSALEKKPFIELHAENLDFVPSPVPRPARAAPESEIDSESSVCFTDENHYSQNYQGIYPRERSGE